MIVYLVALLVLAAALAWLFLGGRDAAPGPRGHRRPSADIDYAELEEAERDVRDAADEDDVRDWGPGAPRPPNGV
ncbi:MAG: hypothetical protein ACREMJ_00885 [Gemmatimonadales bacterium]